MKLELKHLAPYLPYQLMVWNEYSDRKEEMLSCGCSTVECFGRLKTVSDHYDYDEIKPILRPISDLTKDNYPEIWETYNLDLLDMDKFYNHENITSTCSYEFIEELHKHLFDTKGLIKTGVAIDFNSLK